MIFGCKGREARGAALDPCLAPGPRSRHSVRSSIIETVRLCCRSWCPSHIIPLSPLRYVLFFSLCGRARQLTVESTKLKAVEDVPLLPLAGSFFEGKDFPTGDAAKMVKLSGPRCRRGTRRHPRVGLGPSSCTFCRLGA